MQALLSAVRENYDLELGASVQSLTTKFFAKSKAHLLEDSLGTIFVLKRIPTAYFQLTSPVDYFKGLAYFVDHVVNSGLPLVNYLPVRDHRARHFELQGEFYVLYPFVEASPYAESAEEIEDTGKTHGLINVALQKMDQGRVEFIHTRIKNAYLPPEFLSQTFARAKQKLAGCAETESTTRIGEVLPLAETHLEVIPETEYRSLPALVAHKDIWPANVVYENNKVKMILDPDEFMHLPRAREVVYSAWCFATRTAQGQVTPPDRKKTESYLQGYLQHGYLSAAELKLAPALAVRIWVVDFLTFILNADLSLDPLPSLEAKIADINHAVEHNSVFRGL